MKINVGTLTFEAPQDFEWSETTVNLLAPARIDIKDPRMMQSQGVTARHNLVANQRTTTEFKTIEAISADLSKRLMRSIPTMQDLKAQPFSFADGKEGVLLNYLFSFNEKSLLRQYHAVRLDDSTVTSLVLTTDGSITQEVEKTYLECMAQASVTNS